MKAGEGDAGPGQTANWLTDKTHNALLMTLLAPEHPLTDGDVARTASMGAFKTGLPFGPDGSFSVIATFQMPVGDLLGGSWSMAVVARTGDAEDKSDLERLQVSLRANGGAVEMRVQEGANAAKTQKIKGASVPITVAAFQDIYKSPLPFTVQLNVDRKTGKGSAILTTANTRNEIDFQTLQFAHDKPEKVSTVGATLANTNPGQTVSVQLTDFKIWTY